MTRNVQKVLTTFSAFLPATLATEINVLSSQINEYHATVLPTGCEQ